LAQGASSTRHELILPELNIGTIMIHVEGVEGKLREARVVVLFIRKSTTYYEVDSSRSRIKASVAPVFNNNEYDFISSSLHVRRSC
jgi:hypothetical protein